MLGQSNLVKIENYIGGNFVAGTEYIDSFDPSKDEVWARIPDSNKDDVDAAVTAAQTAFHKWSHTSVQERSRYLHAIADLLESQIDSFAEVESRDQGKPVSLAKTIDIPRAVYNFRFFASAILHQINTSTFQDQLNALNYTSRGPVGVAGLISPWNLPLYLLTFKIAPALACGNTVVCKPSEMTSVTAWMLCQVCQDVGLPAGVVNMVFGTGPAAGDALVRHPGVSIISFTGSTATAEKLRIAAAPFCKKLSLELGGKNAAVVFGDANLDKCLPTVIRSSFVNQGEVCLCTSRIFVQNTIFDNFLNKFVNLARAIKVGDPSHPDTWMGALVSRDHMNKVKGYIQIAKDIGATIHTGQEEDRLDLPLANARGYFVPPTIITSLADSSRPMQEEIFGPVVCVVPFTDEKEVVRRVNDVPYGLCASVWSADANRIHRVARQLEVGTVWANSWLVRDLHMPFGGCKASGEGREGFVESIQFYTEVKTVCIQLEDYNPA